jgi:DNA polymerase IV
MQRVIFHLDMDAFYASVEQRDNPALRGKPVIVGAPPTQRGVVCAASYEARKFGVRSAMPSVTAGRLCPKGIFIPPRMAQYREESRRIMEILGRIGAAIEPMSIDEAYLEVSGQVAHASAEGSLLEEAPAIALARQIKGMIRTERRLTATIGISSNKFLSKLASDFNKPDGLTLIPDRDKVLFLRPLPVRAIHGVGQVTELELHKAGILTIGDLQDFRGDLKPIAGSFATALREFAFGNDDRPLETEWESKSISSEETFDEDTDDRRVLRATLWRQAREIEAELRLKEFGAHTVQVKVRYSDFTTLTRQISLEDPVDSARELYRLACFLLGRDRLVTRPLRLLGLGTSSLVHGGRRQLLLFPDE